MSLINKEILPFTAQAFDPKKDQFKEVTQEDLKGSWSVVCFYPADFSFVCPTELEDLQNQYEELQKLGVNVFSVSTDTHFVHKAWHDHSDTISKITYTMIGDPSQTITRNFDVLDEATGLAHKIKAAQYVRKNPGEVCPAKWEEGAKTLQPGLDLVGKI
ncbi:redoxin domain-containing protein [Staphylococcus aureus]|nr:redoxin domain-containing protein [Staphylococcus aureus]